MTTTLMPPGLDLTPDLEAWLRGEVEKPCETFKGATGEQCMQPAEWIGHFRYNCDCGTTATRLLCAECKAHARQLICGAVIAGIGIPAHPLPTVTFIDRLKA